MGTSGEVSSRAMVLQLLLLSCLAATSLAQQREDPTWLIPSQEKPRSQDDQSFCEGELAKTSDTDLYQTRTSEILLPEEFPPAVCIIFPFAPDVLRYGAGTRGSVTTGAASSDLPARTSRTLLPAQHGTRNPMAVTTTVRPNPSQSFSKDRLGQSFKPPHSTHLF